MVDMDGEGRYMLSMLLYSLQYWYTESMPKVRFVYGRKERAMSKWICIDDICIPSEELIARMAIAYAPSIDRPQGWIPCSERLPNEKEIVLITNDKGNVRCGKFRGTYKKWWNWKGNTLETVLAWMPLPKPWKGADDEHDK